MDTYQTGLVTEELRLKIPSEFKKVWLQAEKEVWEPWLSIQDGFLGRQIFWDEEKVKSSLNTNVNPFELIYEGELVKQG